MLGNKKRFTKKTIGQLNNYTTYKPFSWGQGMLKLFIIIMCVFLVFFVGKYIIKWAQILGGYIGKWTINIVSKTMGDDMKKDEMGNVNVMIVGFGGASHAGGYLADAIMVASFNPKLWAVTMLSVPRDLFVENSITHGIGRINALFSHTVGSKKQFSTWARVLADKLQEIMGLSIPYYAMVDFQWLEKIVDTLWGITVNVPQTIHDVTYPDGNMGYMTVHIESGVNMMDGKTALQYARSRHSTSDFSRSLRQQLIIKAIIDKIKQNGLGNVNKLTKLYDEYTQMVTTNITLKEMLGMAKYASKVKHIFSFGYTVECSHTAYRFSSPACFLYNPDRSLFGWASAIIPDGGTPWQVGFYEYTKNFAFYVAHNQEYLIENPTIQIGNGIDKNYAKATIRKSEGLANQIAVKLKKFAFTVNNVKNFSQILTGTTVYVLWTGNYEYTIKMLKTLVPIQQVVVPEDPTMSLQYTGVDMLLVLGNSYVDQLAIKPFSYYK